MGEFKGVPDDKKLIDDGSAPFVYSEGYRGLFVSDGVVCFRFVRNRMTSDSEVTQEVVLNLALPMSTVLRVQRALSELVAEWEAEGLIEAVPNVENEGAGDEQAPNS